MMIFIFLLLQNLSVFADPPLGVAAWRGVQNDLVTYEELISYDWFARKNYSESRLAKPPKKAILNLFRRFRTKVKEIALEFNVDPRLLVGMITTEHTLNVQIDDVIIEGALRSNIEADGSIETFDVSYGFGQIYEEAAIAAEPIVARVRGREVMDMNHVRQNLFTLDGALSYAAATVVAITETYQRYGMDVSTRPGIIASLYNLGKYEEFAQVTKSANRDPRINFFGFYLLKNWEEFHDVIYGAHKNNLVTYQQGQDDLIPAADCEFMKCIYATKIVGGKIEADFYKGAFTTPEPVRLYYAPNRCSMFDSYNVERLSSDVRDFMINDVRAISDEKYAGQFEVMQTALGCEVDDWSLVRFSDSGEMGWVSHEELFKKLDYLYVPQMCTPDYEQCRTDMKGVIQATAQEIDPRYQGRIRVISDENVESVLRVSVLGALLLGNKYFLDSSLTMPICSDEAGMRASFEEWQHSRSAGLQSKYSGFATFDEYLLSKIQKYKDRSQERLNSWNKHNINTEEWTTLSLEQAEELYNQTVAYLGTQMLVPSQEFMIPQIYLRSLGLEGVQRLLLRCQQGCYTNLTQEELFAQIDRRVEALNDSSRGPQYIQNLRDQFNRYLEMPQYKLPEEVIPYISKTFQIAPFFFYEGGSSLMQAGYRQNVPYFDFVVWPTESDTEMGMRSVDVDESRRQEQIEENAYLRLPTEEKFALVERACQQLKEDIPVLHLKIDEYLAEARTLSAAEQEGLFVYGGSNMGLISLCYLYQLRSNPVGGNVIEYPEKLRQALNGYSMGLRLHDENVSAFIFLTEAINQGDIESIVSDYIDDEVNIEKWKADVLKERNNFAGQLELQRTFEEYAMRGNILEECGYDAMNTAKFIQRISQNSCVKQILLPQQKPDRHGRARENIIVKALEREGVSWRMYNFGDDRESFGVVLKEECRQNQ